MIKEIDLYKLGYRVKNRVNDPSRYVDFVHVDFDDKRTYLVNLEEGEITIHYRNDLPQKDFFRTSNLKEFKLWHERYKN